MSYYKRVGMSYYKLDGHAPVPCADVLEWASWFETADRTVAKTTMNGAEVSTVFLGLNHRFDAGPPLIFETIVFGGPLDGEMDRYSTWEEAEQGHAAMLKLVRKRGWIRAGLRKLFGLGRT